MWAAQQIVPGVTRNADGTVTFTPEAFRWIATTLDDSCSCDLTGDHKDCLNYYDVLIKEGQKK